MENNILIWIIIICLIVIIFFLQAINYNLKSLIPLLLPNVLEMALPSEELKKAKEELAKGILEVMKGNNDES